MELQKAILLFFSGIENKFLDKLVEIVTMFGETLFPLAIALFLFWCADKKKGAVSSLIMFSSITVMHTVKAIVRFPRPWVLIPELSTGRIETATGYSFPSGHSTTASSFYSAIAFSFKKRAISIVCAILIVLVPLSRLYLCVHWPLDVFCGTLIGTGMTVVFFKKFSDFFDNIDKHINHMIIAGSVVCGIGLVMAILMQTGSIDETAFSDFSKNNGMLGGVLIAFALEEKYCGFSTEGTMVKKLLRYAVGMAIAFFLLEGTKLFIVKTPITSFFRYLVVGMWTCIYPIIGRKIKLFN